MTVKLLLDLNVIFDVYNHKRRELFPQSVALMEQLETNNNAQGYISSSAFDAIYFIKYKELKESHNEYSKSQLVFIVKRFIEELQQKFKTAKTPSYIELDYEDIEGSQMLASAAAIDAVLVTRDQRLLTQYAKQTLSVERAFALLQQPRTIPFIDLQSQYLSLQSNIEKRIDTILNHGQYIQGPEVKELEEKLAAYVGVKHAITCANGTDALLLALMALGVKQGDAVFCPTFTFFATAEVIPWVGAEPVFVDSDERTFNICPVDLEERIKTVIKEGVLTPKAIIAVDLFGLPANYPEIEKIAKKYNLKLIEDGAQSFGASINGKMAGSFGDIATTSFFPAKPLGCYGDGGAVFTDNDEYAALIRSYCVHGKGEDKYDNVRIGMNSRLDTIQAGILLTHLETYSKEITLRNNIAKRYYKSFSDSPQIILQEVTDSYISVYAQFSILVERREEVVTELADRNIPNTVYYSTPLNEQSAFDQSDINYSTSKFLSKRILSLPMGSYLDDSSQLRIINAVKYSICS